MKWKIKIGNEKLRKEIERTKKEFDEWYNNFWSEKCSKEKMLSEESPVKHVYYKVIKTFDEVKKEYPLEAKQQCLSCKKYVDTWIESEFDVEEYSCGLTFCKNCIDKLYKMFNNIN